MTPYQARARIAAQATPQQRLAVAGIVIANDGTHAELQSRVEELWGRLRALAGGTAGDHPGPDADG
jgi:dephospho-CoA kinase